MRPPTQARMRPSMRRARARGAATPAADDSPTRRAATTSERRPPGRRIPKRVASLMTAAATIRMLPTPTIPTTVRSIWTTATAVKTFDLDHDDFGTHLHPLIEVDNVLIAHADAAR